MIIETIKHSGMIVISDIVNGYLFTEKYIGYSKAQAVAIFKKAVADERKMTRHVTETWT